MKYMTIIYCGETCISLRGTIGEHLIQKVPRDGQCEGISFAPIGLRTFPMHAADLGSVRPR